MAIEKGVETGSCQETDTRSLGDWPCPVAGQPGIPRPRPNDDWWVWL